MKAVCLHDKHIIEAYLRQNTFLHLYALGDLDDFFWQYTTWYATYYQNQQIDQLALLYIGGPTPVLLALSDDPSGLQSLLQAILPLLPRTFDAHLSDKVVSLLAEQYHIHPYGTHYKMALRDYTALNTVDTSQVAPLGLADLAQIEELYRVSYPDNWFDPRMLETGCYFGIRLDNRLVSIAGIHVYSPHYRVATLGNVTTHPGYRKRGLGTATCARLCQVLSQSVEHIGLNVKADNHSAISTYERLGFVRIVTYGEYRCTLKLGN